MPSSRSLAALGLLSAVWAVFCWRAGPPDGDFANYYSAARVWWEGGELARLYDYRFFNAQTARAGFGDRLSGFPVLTPPSALLAAPLLPLGAAAAARVWWVAQCAQGWLIGTATAASLGRPAWWGVAALVLVLPALHSHLVQGQFHLPAVLSLCLGFAAWRSGRSVLAGLLWGLSIGLKVHAWPLLLLAVLGGRWRIVLGMVLMLLVGFASSVLLLGWPLHAVWLTEIAPASRGGWFMDPWHPSCQSFFHLSRAALVAHPGLNPSAPLSHGLLAAFLPGVLYLGAAAVTAAHGLRWDGLSPGHRQRLLAAAALVALATGPLLSSYHLVLLLPPVLWGMDALWRAGARLRALLVAGLTLSAGLIPLPSVWPEGVLLVGAVPRAWLLVGVWAVILPWSSRAGRGGLIGVLLAGLLALRGAVPVDLHADGAQAVDGPGFPLVSADLQRTADGSLWFSGIRADRAGHPGAGWLGFRLRPGASSPEVVASDAGAHVWSPRVTGADTVSWSTALDAPVTSARDCLGGTVFTAGVDGFAQVFWQSSSGEAVALTTVSAHHADPVCDASSRSVYFLTDRGVGVRALRLWRVTLPLPEAP